MKANVNNNAKKNNVKEINECTKIGDVAIIDGYKCTLVGVEVEDMIFKTIAWAWVSRDSFKPFHTKKKAMQIAKKFGLPKDSITKVSFYIEVSSVYFDPLYVMCEKVPLNTKIGAVPID